MQIFKVHYEGEVTVSCPEAIQTFVAADGFVYICTEGEGQAGWEETTRAEYEAAGGVIPGDNPKQPSLGEIKENQLILMDAIATLYETVAGGD